MLSIPATGIDVKPSSLHKSCLTRRAVASFPVWNNSSIGDDESALGGISPLVCPVCERECLREDWCRDCGTNLGYLRRHPRRVALAVHCSILLGIGLFLTLAWSVFAPLLRGWPAGGPAAGFWWFFGLGTFFLTLGLCARQHLARTLRRLLHNPGK